MVASALQLLSGARMSSSLPVHGSISFNVADEAQTARLAARLAARATIGDVFALQGELGAGKSAFARAFISHLAHAGGVHLHEIPSPTFTLVQTYAELPVPVWHYDFYRLNDPSEALELAWDEAQEQACILVEWPQRLGPWMPERRLEMSLVITGAESRHIILTPYGGWPLAERLAETDDA
jgi:tRNA threonylcarbamoyladenosine biosynthesis protein TsaE